MSDAEIIAALGQSEDPFMRALALLASVHLRKHADYNAHGISLEEYFPFGRLSYVQMCWIKVLRLRSLAQSESILNEPFKDTLIDLASYSIIALIAENTK
jgi:hypothetical protein